jgi:hypothetical protein
MISRAALIRLAILPAERLAGATSAAPLDALTDRVRRHIDALNAGDLAALGELVADDVVIRRPSSAAPSSPWYDRGT